MSRRDEAIPVGLKIEKASSPGMAIVRVSDAKRMGSVAAKKRSTALKTAAVGVRCRNSDTCEQTYASVRAKPALNPNVTLSDS